VAGLFYPAAASTLAHLVDGLLASAGRRQALVAADDAPKALIVPHAGYAYSGQTAALGYATLRGAAANRVRHVVLLGPCHRFGLAGIGLPGAEAMATPLGPVRVWAAAAERVALIPGVVTSPGAHAEEHSLEVHLPFLQRVLTGAFDVLPLAVGWARATTVADALDAAWGGDDTLIVVSSDLSHYHPYAAARRLDERTLAQVLRRDPTLEPDQACGAKPVNGLLVAAGRHRLMPSLLEACNSGDTAGDRDRVVGYAAIRFDRSVPMAPPEAVVP
jgi:AmmeMemoRadiSam system protein B